MVSSGTGRAWHTLLALIPLALLHSACADRDAGLEWHGTTRDSAGVTIVSNPADGVWHQGEGWRVEEDLLVGAVEGDPEYLFGHITGICAGSDGRFYVADQGTHSVRAYGPDGVFLHSSGGGGSGPGELGATLGPCLLGPGDTVAIPDLQNFRVNRYAPDGSSVSDARLDLGAGIPLGWDVAPSGRIAVQLRLGLLDPAAHSTSDAIVWWDNNGSTGDTLLHLPPSTAIDRSRGPGQVRYTQLAPGAAWKLTPDGGLFHGSSSDYRITRYDTNGIPTRIVTKAFEPRPLTEADRRILADVLVSIYSQPVIQNVMGGLNFSEVFPAYFQLQVGPHGSLWVQHILRPSSLSADELERFDLGPVDPELFLADLRFRLGAPDWDVFDAQGRFLGVVTLPQGFEPMEFAGDSIYGVWRDEMDVQYVKRLRVMME